MTSAASGMRARMEALDMLANNVANTGTAAFKADREFYNVYASEEASGSGAGDVTRDPMIERHWTDFSQGTLVPSGNPLDLAMSGNGFFVVNGPSGPLYTRNGSFRITKDGQMETKDGYILRVRTPDGKPLKLDSTKPVDVGKDGAIKQDGQPLGRIETVDLDNTKSVSKRGSTYFQWTDSGSPKPAAASEIQQGMVESSNVPVAEAAVRLVSVMRQFEMLQKAMSLGSDMNRRSIEEVAKVSG
jgi:flagellar basal-body rod protein FlgF